VGKGVTPPAEWPRHLGHEARGVPLVRALCQRLHVPNAYRDLAVVVAEYHTHCHRAMELRPRTLLKTLQALDAFRKPARFEQFLLACEADARGREGLAERPYPQADRMRGAYQAARTVATQPLVERGLTGTALAEAIRRARLQAIVQALRAAV
jgi:tRNA nucleotidyltransferase (CCA-adding enzyme)